MKNCYTAIMRRAFQCDTMRRCIMAAIRGRHCCHSTMTGHHAGQCTGLCSTTCWDVGRRPVPESCLHLLMRRLDRDLAWWCWTSSHVDVTGRQSICRRRNVWSSLPPAIRDPSVPSLSLSVFGKLLKTYCLFKGRGADDLWTGAF